MVYRKVAITVDVDGASPEDVKKTLNILKAEGFEKITVFVTGYAIPEDNQELIKILGSEGTDIGLHPDMRLPENLDHLMKTYQFTGMIRTHGHLTSHWLQRDFKKLGFGISSNTCCWLQPNLTPARNALGMWELPVWWEDSIEVRGWNRPMRAEDVHKPGMKVLTFHPHYINKIQDTAKMFINELPAGSSFVYLKDLVEL